jgi:hypothetical protein
MRVYLKSSLLISGLSKTIFVYFLFLPYELQAHVTSIGFKNQSQINYIYISGVAN